MKIFNQGDRVKIVIPDPQDPDHQYHQKTGTITDICEDDLGGLTGETRHNYLYTVDFDDNTLDPVDFRYDDLAPF